MVDQITLHAFKGGFSVLFTDVNTVVENPAGTWKLSSASDQSVLINSTGYRYEAWSSIAGTTEKLKGVYGVTNSKGTYTSGFIDGFYTTGARYVFFPDYDFGSDTWHIFADLIAYDPAHEPHYYITTTATGPGAITVNLGTPKENIPGSSFAFVATIVDPTLHKITACDAPGAIITDTTATFTIVGSFTDVAVSVTTENILPPTYTLSGTLTWAGTTCPLVRTNGIAFVDFGGMGVQGGGYKQLMLAVPGADSDSQSGIQAGDPCNIWCAVPNLSIRISSFIFDNVQQIPDLTLSWATQYKVFTMPSHDAAFAVTMIGDVLCRPGVPVLPDNPAIQPPPPGWTLPPWFPPGVPPAAIPTGNPTPPDPPDFPEPDPDGPVEPTGYPDPDPDPEDIGTTPGDPVGEPPHDPRTDPPNFRGVDWDPSGRTKGLLVRWKDSNKNWTKYHWVSLGKQGQTNLKQKLGCMGSYRTRQYEIVHVDGIPCTIAYLEESLVKLDDTEGS